MDSPGLDLKLGDVSRAMCVCRVSGEIDGDVGARVTARDAEQPLGDA